METTHKERKPTRGEVEEAMKGMALLLSGAGSWADCNARALLRDMAWRETECEQEAQLAKAEAALKVAPSWEAYRECARLWAQILDFRTATLFDTGLQLGAAPLAFFERMLSDMDETYIKDVQRANTTTAVRCGVCGSPDCPSLSLTPVV